MENEEQKKELIVFVLLVLMVLAVGFLVLRNSFLKGEIAKVDKNAEQALESLNNSKNIDPIDKVTDPYRGNDGANNKFYVYSSYSCSHCADFEVELKKLLNENKDKIKIIWKDAISTNDVLGEKAALAARCAQQQNKFWEYHDLLFANQDKLSDEDLLSYAKSLGLNEVEFNSCVTLKKTANLVQASQNEAVAVGVDGTPFTVINGQRLSGVYAYDQLKELIK